MNSGRLVVAAPGWRRSGRSKGLQRQRRAANQVVIDVDEGLGSSRRATQSDQNESVAARRSASAVRSGRSDAVPQRSSSVTGPVEVDLGDRGLVHTSVLNGPLDAGAEHDEVSGICDLETTVAVFELGGKAAEVEAWCELDASGAGALDHPDQVGAACDASGALRAVEIVGDAHRRPRRAQDERIADIGLTASRPQHRRRDRSRSGRLQAAEEFGEDRTGVDAGNAQPGDASIGRDDRCSALTQSIECPSMADTGTGEPVSPPGGQGSEEDGHLLG